MPTLRRAQPNDAEAIAALVNKAYSPYIARIGREPSPMLDDYRQVIEQKDAFVLTDNDEIVGVLVTSQEGTELLLVNVAVSPSHKGNGFGKQLMAYCEEHALTLGCEAVRLYTHERMVENIAIYEKVGYQQTHRANEDGFARVFMRKALDA